MRSWGGTPRGKLCQRGAGAGRSVERYRGKRAVPGPTFTQSRGLPYRVAGTRRGKKGRNGRFWYREKEGELRRRGSRSILRVCPWHPLPFSPLPADLHSSPTPSGTHWVLWTHMHGGAGPCFLAASIRPNHGKPAGLWCPGRLLAEEFRGAGHAKKNGRAVPQFVQRKPSALPFWKLGVEKVIQRIPSRVTMCVPSFPLFPGGLCRLGVPSFLSFSPNVRHFSHYYFFFYHVPQSHLALPIT